MINMKTYTLEVNRYERERNKIMNAFLTDTKLTEEQQAKFDRWFKNAVDLLDNHIYSTNKYGDDINAGDLDELEEDYNLLKFYVQYLIHKLEH